MKMPMRNEDVQDDYKPLPGVREDKGYGNYMPGDSAGKMTTDRVPGRFSPGGDQRDSPLSKRSKS